MDAKHTPGPWRLDGPAANGEQSIGISRAWEIGGASICEVDSSRDHRVLLADARLIAAAPELLAALKAITDELGVPQPGYPAPVANAVAIARAAIAKAEGRAE